MKYFQNITFILLLASTLFLTSCVAPGSKGRISAAEETSRARVENVESMLGSNLKEKIEQISAISYGVDYVLGDIEDTSKEAKIARDLNTRTMSLTGAPNVDEMKKMRNMIDDLKSQLVTAREDGLKALENKDGEIHALQLRSKVLQEAKDAEINRYMRLAQETASRADAVQVELDKMNRFLGLGAVFYGLKKFVTNMAWILGLGSILYLVLRFASISNPIAASIFSIFDQIMSWFVNLIRILAPKALEVAGQTATAVADKYKKVMFKMVDNIEALQQIQKRDPSRKFTIDELLSEFSKSMGDEEKKMIDKVKRDIGY